jgi:PAS domain S-box-containing protein
MVSKMLPDGSIQSFFRDIRERRQHELERERLLKQLQSSESQLQAIMESAPDFITQVDLQGNILYLNRVVPGVTLREAIGSSALDWLPPAYRESTRQMMEQCVRDRRVMEYELLGSGAYGSMRWYRTRMAPVIVQDRVTSVILVSVDITERRRSEEEIAASREQLRALAARLVGVREEERALMAREVHDNLGQMLTSIKMGLIWVSSRLQPEQGKLRERAADTAELIDTTIETVRQISRELRPGILDDLGLVAALEWEVKEFERRTGVVCDFVSRLSEEVRDTQTATALFRILQEALTNVARHAAAHRVEVELESNNQRLRLLVSDNGRGITQTEINDKSALGLLSMRERAYAMGGQVAISGQAGVGTTIVAEVPLPKT